MKLLSWNVNGIRAVHKKGELLSLLKTGPDVLCLQETKADKSQLTKEITNIKGYNSYFVSAEKKGYSGVCIYTKHEPEKIDYGLGTEKFDSEGRTIIAYYKKFILFNIYYPNGKASADRLKYKMEFYDAFLEKAEELRKKKKNIIVCGDVNTAHKEKDLAHPKENETSSGFLPEEREWIDKFLSHGYLDTLRMFTEDKDLYSWWDYKTKARERNIGWRIDYFFISSELKKKIKSAFIMKEVMGSDHCPIGIEIDV